MQFIAEIGANWMGDIDLAKQHIEAAAHAHATGVKFQLFRAKSLYQGGNPALEKYELPLKAIPQLADLAHQKGLQFSITPFAPDLVPPLRGIVDAVKISAYDLTYHTLLKEAAALDVPVVLSTAMATPEEISRAVGIVKQVNPQTPLTLLHGVAAYPASLETMNLRAISTVKDWFPFAQVGLSDHTQGWWAAMLAMTQGATHIEKHFALDLEDIEDSPDYVHSTSPEDFDDMVSSCLTVRTALGNGKKSGPLKIERVLFETCRRTDARPLRKTLPSPGK